MICQTSLDAYLQLQVSGKLCENQVIVLDVFRLKVKNQPLSNLDVAHILEWDINRVTPRVNELVKKGRLVLVGFKRQLETGRRVSLWGLPEDNMTWIEFDYKEVN